MRTPPTYGASLADFDSPLGALIRKLGRCSVALRANQELSAHSDARARYDRTVRQLNYLTADNRKETVRTLNPCPSSSV